MTYNKPMIIWQKWVDPFGDDSEESKWTDYDSENDDVEPDVLEYPDQEKDKQTKSIKVIASPMGLIPYNEHTASGKIFNFWTGHTNFNITKAIIDTLEEIPGVETLDIFTRYRFRVGIGKCFDDASVMSNINEIIYDVINDEYT
jgi:hypothetical protein